MFGGLNSSRTCLISLSFFLVAIVSCHDNSYSHIQPEKLPGIPDSSFWVGGVDGGNWYYIKSIHSHKNNAYINVYSDQTGEMILSKRFIMVCPEGHIDWITDLRTQIVFFDVEKIYLESKEGNKYCWLQ